MNSLLKQAQAEMKKLHAVQENSNGSDDLEVYLDWGRDENGEGKKQLLTVIKNVPRKIINTVVARNKRDPKQAYTGLD